MSPCRELFEALYELVAQELEPQRLEELRQHLGRCPECAALVESYQITIRLSRQLPPAPMPAGCLARLQAAARTHLGGGGAGATEATA